MGFPRRSNPADNDPERPDPLAENMRFGRKRPTGGTEPSDADRRNAIHDQQTVVDSNFSNRSQTRRLRQAGGLSPQGLTTWAADPKNSRTLFIAAGVLVGLLLLLILFRLYNNGGATAADGAPTGAAASAAASLGAPGFVIASPGAGVDNGAANVPQPVQTVPGTDPAGQPAPGGTGQFFVVTGTGTEGLFLRPEASTAQPPIATLPEGARVEFTGEAQNDGTREWRKVRSDLGEGWVAADFLQPAP